MNTFRIFTVIFFLIVVQFIFPEHCHAYPYHNLALLQSVGASSSAPNHLPAFAVDGNDCTFWKPAEDDDDPWIEVFLGSEYEIDHVVLPLFTGLEAYEIDQVV